MNQPDGAGLSGWSALVLAAGGSRRFGAHKLLADLAGAPVLRRTVEGVCALGLREVLVVSGAESDAVRDALAGLPCTVVKAANWAEGLSASIRAGVEALPPGWEGLFLFLGDMPLAPYGPCEELVRLANQSGYAARPRLGEVPGHPVAFAQAAGQDLLNLIGDDGAGPLLRAAGPRLGYLPTTDEGAALDIDTPADLARAARLWNSRFTSDTIDRAMSRGALPKP